MSKIVNIKHIKPLLCIAQSVALSCPNLTADGIDHGGKRHKALAIVKELYAGLVSFSVMTMSFGLMYFKCKYEYPSLKKTLAMIDGTSSVFLFLVNVTSVMSVNFWKKTDYKNLIGKYASIDRNLARFHVVEEKALWRSNWKLATHLILFNALVIYETFLWFNVLDNFTFSLAALESIQRIHLSVFFILAYEFMTLFDERITCIHGLIKTTRRSPKVEADLQLLNKVFVATCEGVSLVNSAFGWSILFFALYNLTDVLSLVNFVLYHHYHGFADVASSSYENHLTITFVSFIVYALIMGISLAHAANNVSHGSLSMAKFCVRLSHAKVCDSNDVKSLMALAEEATKNCPRFSAAGFFNVDHTMLFLLLNMLTSYLIVLIQFLL